jgi:hypothetical protein
MKLCTCREKLIGGDPWQTNARNWPGIDSRHACIDSRFGPRPWPKVDRSRLVQYRRLRSGCGRKTRRTSRHYPSPLQRDGAHSNPIIGQEYHSMGFERASDCAYGCRFRHTTLELEVVDVALADRRGARQPADGPAQQCARRAALGCRDHHSLFPFALVAA